MYAAWETLLSYAKISFNNSLTDLNYNFSKEQYMLPEDDCVIEICRSVLKVLI